MSKYNALWQYIAACGKESVILTFDEIVNIAGVCIDHSFLQYKKDLTAYGYEVEKISMKERKVTFRRTLKNTLVLYVHGKGGSAIEAEHYKPLFPDCNVVGLDYKAETPWAAKEEFPPAFNRMTESYSKVILIANSIGAYFFMCALSQEKVQKAYFISPVVDMEKLIQNMMAWANVTEKDLREKCEIETSFGETLSWQYLCYVRDNPVNWTMPTAILYGEKDNLTDKETISAFAKAHGATLTVMKNGEHWFHTAEQMKFLDDWIKQGEKN